LLLVTISQLRISLQVESAQGFEYIEFFTIETKLIETERIENGAMQMKRDIGYT